ncbi:hypothetical protein LJC08_05925 [Methanimicrococcus sp. OttesenSCG-928-J09]|nr:hypothetical protein [Methanimicrococcus sp. OttesenSCG-928-J09]
MFISDLGQVAVLQLEGDVYLKIAYAIFAAAAAVIFFSSSQLPPCASLHFFKIEKTHFVFKPILKSFHFFEKLLKMLPFTRAAVIQLVLF